MTKIRCDDQYLSHYGDGVVDMLAEAYEYSDDEAHALCALHSDYEAVDEPLPRYLGNVTPPDLSPGWGRVWVRYNGAWFSAEKQEMWVGTVNALADHEEQEGNEEEQHEGV